MRRVGTNMKTTPSEKPRIAPVTDPAEIKSIKRGTYSEIQGWQNEDGKWWAHSYSLERYRARAGKRGEGK